MENKTEIKSFRIIKKMYKYFVEKYRDLEPKLMICEKEDFNNVEKSLKALKIIKEKRVDITNLWFCFEHNYSLEIFNSSVNYVKGEKPLIQEDYDLLKEVLK